MGGLRPERSDSGQDARPVVFRPPAWLRGVVVAASAFWISVLLLLVAWGEPDARAYYGAGFFVLFFTAQAVFYNNHSVEVTGDSLVLRGVRSFREISFADIRKVNVRPGLLQTTYDVLVRRGIVQFTSMLSGHRRLLELIVERARLAPGHP